VEIKWDQASFTFQHKCSQDLNQWLPS